MLQKLSHYIASYKNDSDTNNFIHRRFTEMTETHSFLVNHRNEIEKNKLGFGDRAFHFMWYLILSDLFDSKSCPRLLEIGVFKGQVISLWSLIAKTAGRPCDIECITPLRGNSRPKNELIYFFRNLFDKKFREELSSGNFYGDEDYYKAIEDLFAKFDLSFSDVTLHRGFSTDENILKSLKDAVYDLVYIDGDHRKKIVEKDIRSYSAKIPPGGYLVMDDASYFLPGAENKEYWKGHKSVSEACEIIPGLGFRNILNVGHNRIYQRK